MKFAHMAGLGLWRGGVLLIGGYIAYQAIRVALAITDARLELAVSVVLTGVVFVFASIVGERIQDAREERGRSE